MIKIAFSGGPCTGKTTLIEALRSDFIEQNDVVFVPEAARRFFEKNPVPMSERMRYETQSQIQLLVAKLEREAGAENPELLLCDRSIFDSAIYVALGGDEGGAEKAFQNAEMSTGPYDRIYVLDPRDVIYQADKVRIEGDMERTRIHEAFVNIFSHYKINYTLLSGTLEQRMSQVTNDIKQIGYNHEPRN